MKNTSRILLCAALLGWSAPAAAQELFKTPEEAVDALVGAAKTGDAKAILAVLGPDGKAIVELGRSGSRQQHAREIHRRL